MNGVPKTFVLSLFLFSAPALLAQPAPTVHPALGFTTGGDVVHIRSYGLQGRSSECPGPSCPNYVKFGDAFARIIVNTASEIVVLAPPHAAGAVDVTVGIPHVFDPIVLPNAFRYQVVNDSERILLPVAASGPGPNAARFETEISITNVGDSDVAIGGAAATPSLQSPPPMPMVHPHTTRRFTDSLRTTPGHAGAFLYVVTAMARDIVTKVRVHDTSREATAYGVEIPAVSDGDFATSIHLPGIPTDARFRSTLRVYAYDATNFGPVTLRVRDDVDGALLTTLPITLDGVPRGAEFDSPASVQIALDPIIEPLRTHPRLRFDIADSDKIRLLWGFVSITNNQTQEITLVTPNPSGPAATPEKLPLGWFTDGGRYINVGETETKFYFLCDTGTFKTPSSLDAEGRFTTTGPALTVQGRVADGLLTMTVTPAGQPSSNYYLQYFGAPPDRLPLQCN